MIKAVFLDRDGVLNEEIGNYVYQLADFKVVDGINEVLSALKAKGYILVVITNQAGIAKGRYTHDDVHNMHDYFQKQSGNLIDKFYYAPGHPTYSESLGRKPGTLLFEKAIAKFNIDPTESWMVGDKERDLIPARKLGMKTIRVFIDGFYEKGEETISDFKIKKVKDILAIIK